MRERGATSKNNIGRKEKLSICLFALFLLLLFTLFILRSHNENDLKGKNNEKVKVTEKGVYFHDKCFLPHNRESCAPQYIIAGAMKCGTTSMFSYLQKHPEVLPLRKFLLDPTETSKKWTVVAEKEVRFFNDPYWKAMVKEYGEDTAVSYYFDLFEEIPPPSIPNHPDPEVEKYRGYITGEATPMYICQFGVAQRILSHLPFVKLIFILRNPVDRSYSEYWFRKSLQQKSAGDDKALAERGITQQMIFQKCVEVDFGMMEYCGLSSFAHNPTLDSAESFYKCYHEMVRKYIAIRHANDTLCSDPSLPEHNFCLPREYILSCPQYNAGNSLYFSQLFEWSLLFPKENIKYFKSEDLYEYPVDVMEETSEFLSISPFDWRNVTERTYNIVNPNFAGDRLIVTGDGSKKGLQIGSGDPSDYPPLDPSVRSQLDALFAPYNLLLSNLTGLDFSHW